VRGKLRIYLGAAPGVGKTYAMLDEGLRRRERGTDVVVGLVVTHGRPKTIAQVRDLEVVPPRQVEYRGRVWEELDIDAVLARQPEVVLVDELAHTNVPGCGNEKRWQDIERLLEAGIEVVSTVNIQHLESVNDVVNRITGVTQHETVPDVWVRSADQIELVDMSPEALRRRMAHGNIYPPEKVDAALANFFRVGNLGALREIALLWVADRVEESVQHYVNQHGITLPWETRERVVVAVTGAPGGDDLIRRAARMARRREGDLVGLHVVRSDGLAGRKPELLERHKQLLEELGGSWHEVVGEDVPGTLVRFATAQRATQIVLGTSHRSRWIELTRGSVINRVVRDATGIDVHVIAADRAPTNEAHRGLAAVRRGGRGRPRSAALVTLVALLGVATVATLDSRPAALVTVGALTVVAAIAVKQAVHRRDEAVRVHGEADTVLTLAGRLARPNPPQVVVEEIQETLHREAVALLAPEGGGWRVDATAGAAQLTAPREGEDFPLSDGHVLVMSGAPLRVEEHRLVAALVSYLEAIVTIHRLQVDANVAVALAQANDLRNALLAAVSHDLRTPLASIKALTSGWLEPDVEWSHVDTVDFMRSIDSEADRLRKLVENLLDMSRLQSGALQLMTRPTGVDEIVPAALASLGDEAVGVEVRVPETLPRVDVDPALLERAVANLVDNAVRHSGGPRAVRVEAGAIAGRVDLRVVDQGRGIPVSQRARVFEPFQRLGDVPNNEGIGLGLAVARGFVDAVGGELTVEDTPGGGVTMVVGLPVSHEGESTRVEERAS
jgi:two-component system sensor histidine kinase KdpD